MHREDAYKVSTSVSKSLLERIKWH